MEKSNSNETLTSESNSSEVENGITFYRGNEEGSVDRTFSVSKEGADFFSDKIYPEAALAIALDASTKKADGTGVIKRDVKIHTNKPLLHETGRDRRYNEALAILQGNLEATSKNSVLQKGTNTVATLLRASFTINNETHSRAIHISKSDSETGAPMTRIASPSLRRTDYDKEALVEKFIEDSHTYLNYDLSRTGLDLKEVTRLYGHSEQALAHDMLICKDKIASNIMTAFTEINKQYESHPSSSLDQNANQITDINIQLFAHSLNEVCTSCVGHLSDTLAELEREVLSLFEPLASTPNIGSELLASHYFDFVIPEGKVEGDRLVRPLLSLIRMVYEDDEKDFELYKQSLLEGGKTTAEVDAYFAEQKVTSQDHLEHLMDVIGHKFDANDNSFIGYMAYYLGSVARHVNPLDPLIDMRVNESNIVPFEQMFEILSLISSRAQDRNEIAKAGKFVLNFQNDVILDPNTIKTFDLLELQEPTVNQDETLAQETVILCLEYGEFAVSGLTLGSNAKRNRMAPSTPERGKHEVESKTTPSTAELERKMQDLAPVPFDLDAPQTPTGSRPDSACTTTESKSSDFDDLGSDELDSYMGRLVQDLPEQCRASASKETPIKQKYDPTSFQSQLRDQAETRSSLVMNSPK